MKITRRITVRRNARSFWQSECGALSSEFAVVAALSTILGVTFYETTSSGSRELATGSGFVVENDGPNYSIDGSGPIDPTYYAEYSPEDADVVVPDEEETWLADLETLADQEPDPIVVAGADPETDETPETEQTPETTDEATDDNTTAENNVETAETETEQTETTETTETAAVEDTSGDDTAAVEEPAINPDCILPNGKIKNNCS